MMQPQPTEADTCPSSQPTKPEPTDLVDSDDIWAALHGRQPPAGSAESTTSSATDTSRGRRPTRATLRPIGDGQSNLTYRLDFVVAESETVTVVVRRPPPPPFHPSAHDVAREAGIVEALHGSAVPVPRVLAVTETRGAPTVVSEFLEGEVVADTWPAVLPRAAAADMCLRTSHVLADIHNLETDRLPARMRRDAAPYLERQITRYSRVHTSTVPGPATCLAKAVEVALAATIPAPITDTLVHGDLRLGNIMWRARNPVPLERETHEPDPDSVSARSGASVEMIAVLDWELAALGDPDADLAYTLMAHPCPDGPSNPISDMARALHDIDERPNRTQLAAAYSDRAGRTSRSPDWFDAFVRWRAAVGLEFLRQRHLNGELATNDWLRSLDRGVPDLLGQAAENLDLPATISGRP